MSTADDKSNGISEETAGEKAPPPPIHVQPEEVTRAKAEKSLGFVILFFILGLAASMVVGWVVFPKLLYSKKQQPVDFNHVLHVEAVDNGCESCHFFRADGTFSGVPKLAQCIGCHQEQQGETDGEATFVNEYVLKGRQVPWRVYSRQPDSVFFSHGAHVTLAKMDCVTCHGHIGESDHLKAYEENRISGYSRDIWGKNIAGLKKNPWDRMKMDDCANCHAERPDPGTVSGVEPSARRLFTNAVGIVFPNSIKTGRNSSVQTQKDACFVCHK